MAAELFAAIRAGDRPAVERLLEQDRRLVDARDESGLSPILVALYHGRTEVAGAILQRSPSLSVFEAAAAGDGNRLRELIQRDPALINAVSSDGYSPLGLAAFFKRRAAVKVLLDAGADTRLASRREGFTPLHSAIATDAGPSDDEIVRMLLEAGADPNAMSHADGTPLHTAAFTGDRGAVDLLLRHGASAEIRNHEGKTPRDLAAARNDEIVRRFDQPPAGR